MGYNKRKDITRRVDLFIIILLRFLCSYRSCSPCESCSLCIYTWHTTLTTHVTLLRVVSLKKPRVIGPTCENINWPHFATRYFCWRLVQARKGPDTWHNYCIWLGSHWCTTLSFKHKIEWALPPSWFPFKNSWIYRGFFFFEHFQDDWRALTWNNTLTRTEGSVQ